MVVLEGSMGETVKIGEETTVTVLSVSDDTVRLGVSAPKDRSIHRLEIYKRIQLEKKGVE